ncbi:MAG: PAS domain-containing protein [Campylobacterota bacterium]|nr:PAS domain-containing protein [Campylobacterota bacterium]
MDSEVKLSKGIMIVSETDAKGNIIFANRDFCNISGYSREELIDKPHNIVRDPSMPKAAFEDLWRTIKSGATWTGIVKNKTKNGKYYWVNATVYSSKNDLEELIYISIRVKPTDQEILEAEKLYKTLV